MTEAGFSATAEQFGFKKVGEISLRDDHPIFNLDGSSDGGGFVYLWVEISGSASTVVYVGKAGGTLLDRCKQHSGGFKHSSPGRAHAHRLRRGIAENKRYAIYARKSETQDMFGERGISMACVEEQAFIKKFRPSWNAPFAASAPKH
jgi:hypothetical protein